MTTFKGRWKRRFRKLRYIIRHPRLYLWEKRNYNYIWVFHWANRSGYE